MRDVTVCFFFLCGPPADAPVFDSLSDSDLTDDQIAMKFAVNIHDLTQRMTPGEVSPYLSSSSPSPLG